MCRWLLPVSLSVLVVVAACSGDNSEYQDSEFQAQRQEMADALYRGMADDDVGDFDIAGESRCIAQGVVSAFSDSRFAELKLDTAEATASIEEVFDDVELTGGEKDEILEVLSSCVDWEAFTIAGLSEGLAEEGIPEENARCLVDSVSEESIDAAADAMLNWASADILGEEGSSEENLVDDTIFSIGEEMLGELPRCMRLGESEDSG